ncbi:hypothetical protein [Nannocystis pusilla]|uniref:hypothetical protein n=1 Tax=Nannocystis pusilla TaxID=889268 RepID=UPI003B80EE16
MDEADRSACDQRGHGAGDAAAGRRLLVEADALDELVAGADEGDRDAAAGDPRGAQGREQAGVAGTDDDEMRGHASSPGSPA